MNTKLRFALHLLLPPFWAGSLFLFVGGLALLLDAKGWGRASLGNLLSLIGVVFLVSYMIALLPSLLFASVLGLRQRARTFSARRTYIEAGVGGLLSGLLISLFLIATSSGRWEWNDLAMPALFLAWGTVTGLLTQAVVHAVEHRSRPPV